VIIGQKFRTEAMNLIDVLADTARHGRHGVESKVVSLHQPYVKSGL
jgi:hypothetical protein